MVDDAAEAMRAKALEAVWDRLETGDSWQAAAWVEAQEGPAQVAEVYANLIRDLYGKKHDVPRMILIGQAGIRYCLTQSQTLEQSDPDTARKLKGYAKMNSYNLSVNTWPAWEDEGIVITRSDQRIGLDAARLNLRLAHELNRDAEKVGNAWWLLGAHCLGLGEHDKGAEHLERAIECFRTAEKPEFEQMCVGYAAIVRLDKDRGDAGAQAQFDDAVAALRTLGTDDAKFFAEQLVSVDRYFAKQ